MLWFRKKTPFVLPTDDVALEEGERVYHIPIAPDGRIGDWHSHASGRMASREQETICKAIESYIRNLQEIRF